MGAALNIDDDDEITTCATEEYSFCERDDAVPRGDVVLTLKPEGEAAWRRGSADDGGVCGARTTPGESANGPPRMSSHQVGHSRSILPPPSPEVFCSPGSSEHAACVEARRESSRAVSVGRRETITVFDWDDTLFPTHYVKTALCELGVSAWWQLRQVPTETLQLLRCELFTCARRAEALLRLAHALGGVVIVTLAKESWIQDSCDCLFSNVGAVIHDLGIKVACAQRGSSRPPHGIDGFALNAHWEGVKRRTIASELYDFYGGQSWKNVLSIGDSDFERFATMRAVEDYAISNGLRCVPVLGGWGGDGSGLGIASTMLPENMAITGEVQGSTYRIRTKTLKLVEHPEIRELVSELELLLRLFPRMVSFSGSFDQVLSRSHSWEESLSLLGNISRQGCPCLGADDSGNMENVAEQELAVWEVVAAAGG